MQNIVSFFIHNSSGDLLMKRESMHCILSLAYISECIFCVPALWLCAQGFLEAICQIISELKSWCSLWGKFQYMGHLTILWTPSKLGKWSSDSVCVCMHVCVCVCLCTCVCVYFAGLCHMYRHWGLACFGLCGTSDSLHWKCNWFCC